MTREKQHAKQRAKSKQATKELSMRKQNRQTKLSKIALWLYGFYCFFIVGVTYMRNDYYKKAIIP